MIGGVTSDGTTGAPRGCDRWQGRERGGGAGRERGRGGSVVGRECAGAGAEAGAVGLGEGGGGVGSCGPGGFWAGWVVGWAAAGAMRDAVLPRGTAPHPTFLFPSDPHTLCPFQSPPSPIFLTSFASAHHLLAPLLSPFPSAPHPLSFLPPPPSHLSIQGGTMTGATTTVASATTTTAATTATLTTIGAAATTGGTENQASPLPLSARSRVCCASVHRSSRHR